MSLNGKTILITGSALRIGRSRALAVAQAGGDVVIHYGKSQKEAESLKLEFQAAGRKAFILQADLDEVGQALIFLLNGPAYITGEIIHVDGGRHLV